jgi:hypothetical protein
MLSEVRDGLQIALAMGVRIVKYGLMTRRKKTLWIWLGIVAALLVVRLATSPVIFRVPFFTQEHSDQPRFTLLNPFRSRAPEEAGNRAVRSIEAGQCKEAVESSDMEPKEKAYICGWLADWPVHWDLRNRTDSGDKSTLYYWNEGTIMEVWVRKVEGTWKLHAIYMIA